jgi:hypothetical protein
MRRTASAGESSVLSTELQLSNGVTLSNWIAQSAVTDHLATGDGAPSWQLIEVYRRFAVSGAGLIISDNVMVNGWSLETPRNVVIEDGRHMPQLRRWAATTTGSHARLILQRSLPGRQTQRGLALAGRPANLKIHAPGNDLVLEKVNRVDAERFVRAVRAATAATAGIQAAYRATATAVSPCGLVSGPKCGTNTAVLGRLEMERPHGAIDLTADEEPSRSRPIGPGRTRVLPLPFRSGRRRIQPNRIRGSSVRYSGHIHDCMMLNPSMRRRPQPPPSSRSSTPPKRHSEASKQKEAQQ